MNNNTGKNSRNGGTPEKTVRVWEKSISGNVGIGTGSPRAKLEINAGRGEVVVFNNTNNPGAPNSISHFGASGGTALYIGSNSYVDSGGKPVYLTVGPSGVLIKNLTGSGNAFVCANAAGIVYRSATACA